ncbi:hypothetical protein GQ367_07290 [Polynucleobacter sp. MWH-CaK5]|uniref:hypothetical protein n=1 Tax=Polynucleobacter sp. MWH-CaK5 TaxID=2689107 RepID=UPI001BFD371F|nr:hypothetical protein [Polynucleobacter sp. MWH-CaK5]QWD88679.1 hypothetical protein GQ367_07290 [Polynucleobacter sp. MWH-CaK5]
MSLFEYKAYSTHPEIIRQAEVLVEEMLSLRQRKPNKNDKTQYLKWMKVAIAGLYLIGGYQKDSVQIPVSRNLYYGKTRRNKLYQPELLKCFMWLRDAGYMQETKPAHQDKNGNWTPAAYALTRKWLDVACQFSPYHERRDQILKSVVRNPSLPVIELRKDGKRMRTNPHKEKWLWEKRIKAYNERLTYFDFRLNRELIPPVTFSITRIFNDGSYDRGGRYYSTAQGFKSQLRLHLTINNEPVVEVDYRGLHPSLLYQRAGLEEPTEDAYTIDGYPRKLVKKAFNILINRKKPAPATKSLIFYLNKNKKEYVDDKHPIPPTIDTAYCEALEKAIRDRHKPIEHFFCTGVGLELQNHDSLLCSHIFDYFLAKTGSIVLAVHDSFIVKQSDIQHLAEAFRYAEFAVAKSLGIPYREPLLEAERITEIDSYKQDLNQYFGSIIDSKVTEEKSLIANLNTELESLDDIESLADEDADYANELP